MLPQYADVCCASLPPGSLAALAAVRATPGVMVLCQPERIWVRWQAGDEELLRRIMPISGAILYCFRQGHWYRLGGNLPAFEVVSDGEFQSLCRVLLPAPVQPLAPQLGPWSKISLSLCPQSQPRPTTALIASLDELLSWAETVPSRRLARLQAARNGNNVFVLGARLPSLPTAQRFWGNTVFKPLGFGLKPDLAERIVRECLQMADGELLIVSPDGGELLSRSNLRVLNRASLRMAVRGAGT